MVCMIVMSAVNCTEPPERPPSGTWEWAGSQEYLAEADYTCGLYGMFQVKCLCESQTVSYIHIRVR